MLNPSSGSVRCAGSSQKVTLEFIELKGILNCPNRSGFKSRFAMFCDVMKSIPYTIAALALTLGTGAPAPVGKRAVPEVFAKFQGAIASRQPVTAETRGEQEPN